ncbi:MAG: threonine/serine dehydratase [Planctomycetaceae bacterium]
MSVRVATMEDIHQAEQVIRRYISPAPLIRSYPLEQELGLPPERRVWLKDYGWTPVGSFKLLGALNWMSQNRERIGERPVVAHSSGNFASGLAFAGAKLGVPVVIVMPDTASQIKFERTRSFGAKILTYDIARDHETGERDRLTRELAVEQGAIQASPYDDADVIAGNGVGGLEIVRELQNEARSVSHFLCQVSGGGLMAGHALAVSTGYPQAEIIGVEPDQADDFCRSLSEGRRVRLDRPTSICDGLLSYDVGEHNWPLLKEHVNSAVSVPDDITIRGMRWLYDQHGLRTEPSGAITVAALLSRRVNVAEGEGDVVIVISGRNVDEPAFREWIG